MFLHHQCAHTSFKENISSLPTVRLAAHGFRVYTSSVLLPVRAYAISDWLWLSNMWLNGGLPPLHQADAYNEADVTFLSFRIPYRSQFLTVFFTAHAEIRKVQYHMRSEEWRALGVCLHCTCVVHHRATPINTQVNAEQTSWDMEMYLIMTEWANSFSSRRLSNSIRLCIRKI